MRGCHRGGRGCRFGGHGKGGHKWGQKRAVILSKPEEVVECYKGKVNFIEVEVENQTHWPWKPNCYVGLVNRSDLFEKCPIPFKDYIISEDVRGLSKVKLNVPIEIPVDFKVPEEVDVLDL